MSRLSPPAGWLSLVLLALMAMVVGWAVDDARWVPGPESLTDFLPWAGLGGVLAGGIGGILGLGRFRAALAGAVVAAIAVPLLVGSVILPGVDDYLAVYRATAEAAYRAFVDLVVRGQGTTSEFGHFLLALALLMWGTAQFAAYAVFGHGRAMPAVVSLGTLLLVNVILTVRDQYLYVVAFSALALFLLVRLHAVDERGEWLRRRIGDPAPLTSVILRAGTVFVTVAIVGSLALTATARSDPLRDAWTGAEGWLVDTGRVLQRWFPFLTNARGPAGVDFGDSVEIGVSWTSDPSTAAVIALPTGEDEAFYWRASTYDQYVDPGWTTTDVAEVDRAANEPLLAGSFDAPGEGGRRPIAFRVEPAKYRGAQILSPDSPTTIDQDVVVHLVGPAAFLGSVDRRGGNDPYTVSAEVITFGDDDPAAVTENKLRAAGDVYPAELARYLVVPPGVIGPDAAALLASAESTADSPAAYDLAVSMVRVLTGPSFEYDADVSDVDCGNESRVECFARVRRGFCLYFASTMAVLLREAGVPTRLAQGFLPGERASDGSETISMAGAHAWVEVWFPGYGWQLFDPTKGRTVAVAPPEGEAVPSPSPRPSAGPDDDVDPSRPPPSIPGGGTAPPSDGGTGFGAGPFIAIGVLLGGAMVLLAITAYRRGPREVTADGAWRTTTGLATRLGFGPRPTQTIYEYAAALGDVLPDVRPELHTVARAKVEVAYGHRILGADRMAALRAATARLRFGLWRLVLRRGRGRRR